MGRRPHDPRNVHLGATKGLLLGAAVRPSATYTLPHGSHTGYLSCEFGAPPNLGDGASRIRG